MRLSSSDSRFVLLNDPSSGSNYPDARNQSKMRTTVFADSTFELPRESRAHFFRLRVSRYFSVALLIFPLAILTTFHAISNNYKIL